MEKDRELEKLVQNSEKQLKHVRFQSLMAAVAAVCFVILAAAALVVAPRLMDVSRQLDTIYTAELMEANGTWEYGLTPDEVRAAFSLIATEWTSGD